MELMSAGDGIIIASDYIKYQNKDITMIKAGVRYTMLRKGIMRVSFYISTVQYVTWLGVYAQVYKNDAPFGKLWYAYHDALTCKEDLECNVNDYFEVYFRTDLQSAEAYI
ncbi:hypothetical protein [Clostridium sp. CF012]|uniref:hypothetical protein n=1 Tax=Clostridium sp. CF012 TaxID=2843319 RepID=UPI001C0DBDDA|nr:hypothetical protein [Clostridium sp. CF012]MBU3146747.1 hypothetical protein [Clostridium sp. CF012]